MREIKTMTQAEIHAMAEERGKEIDDAALAVRELLERRFAHYPAGPERENMMRPTIATYVHHYNAGDPSNALTTMIVFGAIIEGRIDLKGLRAFMGVAGTTASPSVKATADALVEIVARDRRKDG